LTHLTFPAALPDDALLHLASLPNLRHFTYTPNKSDYPSLLSTIPRKFSPLQKLKIIAENSMECTISFLSALGPYLLVDLEVSIPWAEAIPQITESELQHLFAAVAALKALKRFIIDAPSRFEKELPVAREVALSPLFALRGLLELKFIHIPVDPSPTDIETMANSWPDLQCLSLSPYDLRDRMPLTVNDLAPFARHCPKLVHLGIQVQSAHLPIASADFPRSGQNACPLKTLVLGYSEIQDSSWQAISIAAKQVFPQAQVEHTARPN
jgi:hypothetical protein